MGMPVCDLCSLKALNSKYRLPKKSISPLNSARSRLLHFSTKWEGSQSAAEFMFCAEDLVYQPCVVNCVSGLKVTPSASGTRTPLAATGSTAAPSAPMGRDLSCLK